MTPPDLLTPPTETTPANPQPANIAPTIAAPAAATVTLPDRAELATETARQPGGALDPDSWVIPTGEKLTTFLRQEPDQARIDRYAFEWMREGMDAQTKGQGGGIAEDYKNGLRAYREFRKARGESSFQYLPAARTRSEERAAREQVPFFQKLFTAPERMAEAFPEDQRQAFEERFTNALDPIAEKHKAAGVLLVSSMLNRPAEEVADLWPAYRAKYAAEHLGISGTVTDAAFYQAAAKAFDQEAKDDETARSIAQQAQHAAIQGRPLSYAIDKGKAATGESWKRFAPAARAGYASILSQFSDAEIRSARALFESLADMEGKPVDDIAQGDGTRAAWVIALESYGASDQQSRDRIMNLIGLQAGAEGQELTDYFKRLGAAFGSGMDTLSGGLGGLAARTTANDFQNATTDPAADPETKAKRQQFANYMRGKGTFAADISTAGVKVSRYIDEQRGGFWDTAADWSILASESLPVMAAAALPMGAGLPAVAASYAERNLSTLRREAPNADEATLAATAYTSGALEAGIDRVQWFTLGARVPKFTAKLMQYGKPGAVAVGAARIATVTAAETGQEAVQNFSLPAVQELAAALSQDIPGPNWSKVFSDEADALGDIAGVSLIFGIIGGTGSTVLDYVQAPKIAEALKDRDGLALAGYSPETVEEVATMAETNPAAAAETLKAAMAETPKKERQTNAQAARDRLEQGSATRPEFRAAGGKVTSYGYASDETPDANSAAGIGAWVSDEEADRIRAGEDTPNKLRAGDLAVSPDIEEEFRRAGIAPGDTVTVRLDDGTQRQARWMDRTAADLSGRFDFYSPDGIDPLDGRAVLGFSHDVTGEADATAADAGIPTMEKQPDGRVIVKFPDAPDLLADSPESALESIREWDHAQEVDTTKAVREYLGFLTDYHASSPEAVFTGKQTNTAPTLETWAGNNKARIAQANARVDILIRQAGASMGIERPLLSEVPILGTSRNVRAGAITRMVAEIHKGGNPLTVIEEAAEGIGKWLIEDSKISESKLTGWIRQTEQHTRTKILADDIANMTPEARAQELAEAFSYIAKNNAVGRIQDSALPSAVRSWFRAFKEAIAQVLRIAADFARLRSEGKVNPEFAYWLDVAAGLEPEYQLENLSRQMEAEQLAEAMSGFTEIQDALKGKLPRPETLEAAGDPLADEVRRLWEGMLENPDNGANKAARTRKANDRFLPKGTAGNLDEIRRSMNEQGFDFQTPAEMIEAADLSINYGRKVFGTTEADPLAGEDMDQWEPTFSIGGPNATLPVFMRDSLDAARSMAADGKKAEEIRAVTGWFPGRYDGKMRFEIPDQAAKIDVARDSLEDPRETAETRLSQILDHRALFEAYPDARNIRVEFNPDAESLGAFYDDLNLIQLKAKAPGGARDEMRWQLDRLERNTDLRAQRDFEDGDFPTLEAALEWHQQENEKDKAKLATFKGITGRTFSTILHEVQHWIQRAEGFAAGGSPAGMPRMAREIASRIYLTGKPSAAFEAMNAARVADYAWLAKTWRGNPETLTRSTTWFQVKSMSVPKKGSPERAAYMAEAVERGIVTLRDSLESWQAADFTDALRKDRDELRRIARNEWKKANTNANARAQYERMREIEYNQDPKKAREFYRLLAGEIEARDVQARQDFTDEQRAAVAPYSSENIAERDAIVIFGDDSSPSFSIALRTDPLLAAIESRIKSPEKKAEVWQKMKTRVSAVKRRYEDRRLRGEFDNEAGDIDKARFEELRDIATLEAIGRAMPPDIRGKIVGSFRKLADLKTTKGRQAYLVKLLPKIEQALESSLRRNYRAAIRRQMKQAAFKVADSKTRGGKIGAIAHAVFEEAKAAIKLTDDPPNRIDGKTATEKAEEAADKLRAILEGSPDLTDEQILELDGRIAALELFGGYGDADSARLAQALALLNGTYSAGREEWLAVLTSRRAWRAEKVATVEKAMGRREGQPILDVERTTSKRRFESLLSRVDEAIMAAGLSGSQKIRRLAELSADPEIKAVTEDMELAFLEAENQEADANTADNQALADAMRRLFGTSTEYGTAKKLRELTTAKGPAPVEKVEGFKKETVKVPLKFVESILAGELDAMEAGGERFAEQVKAFDDQDLAQLEMAWEEFNDLPEDQQAKKRNLSFERIVSAGARVTIGPVNQLEGLQLYLTMRQPDQAVKLERLGYDEETLAQLEEWLRPEVKALGTWMVDHIGAGAFTLDSIHRAEKGVGLKLVDSYFPVRNDVSGADNSGLSIDGGQTKHTGRSIGAIKERTPNNASPAYVNALAVFLANRAQVNFWTSHVSTLREWGGVIRDERFAAAVKLRMGETFYQSLDTMLKRTESGGSLNAAKLMDWERVVKSLTSSFAVGTLGGRVSTLAVNVAAGLNAGLEIPAADLAAGIAEVFARPEAFKDAFNSPAIQRRLAQGASFEAQLAKSSGPSRAPTLAQLNAWAQKGVVPINYVDTGANVIGAAVVWEHTRRESMRAGMTDEQARAEADRKVSRLMLRAAQPTTRLAKSELELKMLENPLAALFTLFTSEPRKTLAIAYLAARELTTGKGTYGKPMAAQQLFVALAIMQTADFLIRSAYAALTKADDDEPENPLERLKARIFDAKAWGYALLTTHLRSVPIGGEVWNQAWAKAFDQKAFQSSPNPLNRAAREVLTFEKPETAGEAIDGGIDIVQGVGPVIPGGALFAQGGNLAEFFAGLATSNGLEFSDEDRAKRIKARFNAFRKELDAIHGKTTGEDGKIRKDVQKVKRAAMIDRLQSDLAPASPEIRRLALAAIDPPEEVKKALEKTLKILPAKP